MREISVTIDQGVNAAKLHEEIKAALAARVSGISARGTQVRVHLDDAATVEDETTATNVCAAHDPAEKTEAQLEQEAKDAAREQVKAYMRRQLIDPNPDVAAVKAQVESYVGDHPKLGRALANVAALYGYDTGTNAGYLQAALLLVALME